MARDPDFVIVGAMRAGTTSLCRQLERAGGVAISRPKELHYFDRHYHRGPTWYQSRFSAEAPRLGEATPNYLYHPEALARLARDLPEVRVVITLRHPAARAWSHYWHNVARGKEPLGFGAAIEAEPARIARGGLDADTYSYVDRGRYGRQLDVVGELFAADQVHLLALEAHQLDPARSLTRLLEFLDAPKPRADDLRAATATTSNQAVRFRSVRLRNRSRSFPPLLQRIVGRVNTISVPNPRLGAADRALVTERVADDRDRLAARLARWSVGVPWLEEERVSPQQ